MLSRRGPALQPHRSAHFATAAGLAYENDAAIKAVYPVGDLIIRELPKNQCRYFLLINTDHQMKNYLDRIRTVR
jgi:hypothetical protein